MKDKLCIESAKDVKLAFMEEWYRGENPELEEYADRYPQFAHELAELAVFLAVSESPQSDEGTDLSSETLNAVERGLKASRSEARSIMERMREIGISPVQLAYRLDLPTAIVSYLQRKMLVELPRQFVYALARELVLSVEQVLGLIAPPAVRTTHAFNYRAEGRPSRVIPNVLTFREALLQCHEKNLTTEAQFSKWLSERSDVHG